MESFVTKTRILVLASHSMGLLEKWCDTGILLRQGQVVMTGLIEDVISAYKVGTAAPKIIAAAGKEMEEQLSSLSSWREYNQRGVRLAAERRFEAALADFNEAIRLAPPVAVLHQRRGTVRMATEDILGAMEDFEAALALDPQNATIQTLVAKARQRYESAGLSLTI